MDLNSSHTSPKKNLIQELQTTQSASVEEITEEQHRKPQEMKTNSIQLLSDNDEMEELPRKMILCMKQAMQELITPIEDKLKLLDTKQIQEQQALEIADLKNNQSELYRRCLKFKIENDKLKRRIEELESTMLEGNLIMHGLKEDEWEPEDNRRERIYHAISSMVDAEDCHARLDIARSIPIRTTKRIGKYKAGKDRPISISFEKKSTSYWRVNRGYHAECI